MSTITKEGIQVKVGQIWLDLDKRADGRKRIVVALEGDKAVMGDPTTQGMPTTRVSIRRMHKSSTGWALASCIDT